jgi:hypothetical protein
MNNILNLDIIFVEKKGACGDAHSIVYKGEKMVINFSKVGNFVKI